MPSNNFLEGVSHAILAGTSIYCLLQIKNENLFCAHMTYGIIAVNNFIAVFWWASDYNQRFYEIYNFTTYCQLLFTLPCITTTVWLQNGYQKEWSWAWTIVPVVALVLYMARAEVNVPLVEMLILLNLVGLGFVSVAKEINMGIAAVITYALSHAFRRHIAFYNYGLSFFCYFALRAIGFGPDIFN